jgi:hypothetical protein
VAGFNNSLVRWHDDERACRVCWQMMLFSWEIVLSWKSHQSVFNYLLQDHYLRNTLSIKILPLDLVPTGKVVSAAFRWSSKCICAD